MAFGKEVCDVRDTFSKYDLYTNSIMNLIIMPMWVIYDVVVFSLAGILSDLFTFLSIVIAMTRLDRMKNKTDSCE